MKRMALLIVLALFISGLAMASEGYGHKEQSKTVTNNFYQPGEKTNHLNYFLQGNFKVWQNQADQPIFDCVKLSTSYVKPDLSSFNKGTWFAGAIVEFDLTPLYQNSKVKK